MTQAQEIILKAILDSTSFAEVLQTLSDITCEKAVKAHLELHNEELSQEWWEANTVINAAESMWSTCAPAWINEQGE